MKDELVLNILAIGSVEWYKNFSTRYAGLSKTYKFEFISDLDKMYDSGFIFKKVKEASLKILGNE